jgi:hypothetical protein
LFVSFIPFVHLFIFILISHYYSLGGGGPDGGSGGGGSSISFGHNTVYTSGFYLPDYYDGKAIIELFSHPFYQFSLCTKQVQNITVPPGTYFLAVDLAGGSGGLGGAGLPGYGARVQSYFTVIPGTLLFVSVGCTGTGNAGGFNGGGAPYYSGTGGGGATDIRLGGLDLSHRIIVAGGGGGSYQGPNCGLQKGGDGGKYGLAGSGSTCDDSPGKPSGQGGTWSKGGRGGPPRDCLGNPVLYAKNGTLGFGGAGGCINSAGGGGGYYGGNKEKTLFFFTFYD